MSTRDDRPGDLYWSLVGPIWDFVDIYGTADEFLGEYRVLPKEVGLLFAAHWCHSEVCNGGFHQFFYNDTGVLAPEAAAGFRAIGLSDCAEVMDQAMRLFGDEYPRDQDARIRILDEDVDRKTLRCLDDRFFGLLKLEEYRFERAADEYAHTFAASKGDQAGPDSI